MSDYCCNPLIFGKNSIERITSCEVHDGSVSLFIEQNDGTVLEKVKPNHYWILAPIQLDSGFSKLNGNLYYSWIKLYKTFEEFKADKYKYYKRDIYVINDAKEASMVINGFSYFKGMKVQDVSVLAFDIESTGLSPEDPDAKALLIANTFRKNGIITRKVFSYNEYETEAQFFDAWSSWVREINPSILLGHNIVIFDLPYMATLAEKAGTFLKLGRDNSNLRFNNYDSQFRKDGSQSYTYKKCYVFGREVIDTFFLSMKYDIGRKYPNYKLKQIIKFEGLEVENRQFYDADQIRYNYKDPEEWKKIVKYAEHDGDDALSLFDLMVPSFFYLNVSVPKSFQQIIESASGSQINSMMVRSYLQEFHSIPKPSDPVEYEGAISFGNSGVYQNCFKFDAASLYPSIMLANNVYDRYKDPRANMLNILDYFTTERLTNKRLAKETGDKYFKDLEQSEKIIINSIYGFCGSQGLNFNSPINAAFVTKAGREILTKAIEWAKPNYNIPNGDTDSIMICRPDMSFISKEDREKILRDVNALFPERIHFEDDGYYTSVLIIKAKNYVLKSEDGKIKIKGSALKATMKEPALQTFIKEVVDLLLENKTEEVVSLYHKYVQDILNLKDITPWALKKTVTSKVINAERTNEQKVLDAINEEDEDFQEGDKVFLYFTTEGSLKLASNWSNDHCPYKLIEKLWKTAQVFSNIIDKELFVKYHLKTKRKLLSELVITD